MNLDESGWIFADPEKIIKNRSRGCARAVQERKNIHWLSKAPQRLGTVELIVTLGLRSQEKVGKFTFGTIISLMRFSLSLKQSEKQISRGCVRVVQGRNKSLWLTDATLAATKGISEWINAINSGTGLLFPREGGKVYVWNHHK